jgi:hypothetical protein
VINPRAKVLKTKKLYMVSAEAVEDSEIVSDLEAVEDSEIVSDLEAVEDSEIVSDLEAVDGEVKNS